MKNPTLSTRDIRQITTYKTLIPLLKSKGVVLSQNKKIQVVAERNLKACQGSYWEDTYRDFMNLIKNDDYESLHFLLTSENPSHEKYRVISPIITVYRDLVDRDPNRVYTLKTMTWRADEQISV